MARYSGKISYLKAPNCEEILRKTRIKAQNCEKIFGKKHFDCKNVENFDFEKESLKNFNNNDEISIEKAFEGTNLIKV